jgi:hypothetical protein
MTVGLSPVRAALWVICYPYSINPPMYPLKKRLDRTTEGVVISLLHLFLSNWQ